MYVYMYMYTQEYVYISGALRKGDDGHSGTVAGANVPPRGQTYRRPPNPDLQEAPKSRLTGGPNMHTYRKPQIPDLQKTKKTDLQEAPILYLQEAPKCRLTGGPTKL